MSEETNFLMFDAIFFVFVHHQQHFSVSGKTCPQGFPNSSVAPHFEDLESDGVTIYVYKASYDEKQA